MAKKQINELDVLTAVRPSDIVFARDATDGVDKQFTLPDSHPMSAQVGTFTPTLTANTPGDIAVTYNSQKGVYRRHGDLISFRLNLNVDVTHSTASGAIRINGMPYAIDQINGGPENPVFDCQVGSFDTWAGSATARFMVKAYRSAASQVSMLADGPGLATGVFSISDLVSPKTGAIVQIYGFYTTSAAFA